MSPGLVRIATTVLVGGIAVVAFGGWVFGLVEHIATRMMAPWSFRIGPRVLVREMADPDAIDLAAFAEPSGRQGDLRYRRLDADTWIFHVAPPMSFRLRVNTPFPLKATLRVDHGRQLLEARVPLGPLAFLGAWLLGWSVGSMAVLAKAANWDRVLSSIAFGGTGVLFAIVMVWTSLRLERRRLLESLSLAERRM